MDAWPRAASSCVGCDAGLADCHGIILALGDSEYEETSVSAEKRVDALILVYSLTLELWWTLEMGRCSKGWARGDCLC